MPRDNISKTAQVNVQVLAGLGLPEVVRFRDALQQESDPRAVLSRIPYARRIPVCISTIPEALYRSAIWHVPVELRKRGKVHHTGVSNF